MSWRSEAPIIRHLATVAAVLLGAAVAWAPLPFGSVEPAAETALRLAAALLLALAAPLARAERLRPVALPALALVALAALGALQSLPWPPWLADLLSPRHARIWGRAAELLATARQTTGSDLPVPGWPRLSLDPGASRQVAVTLVALAALLAASALIGRSRRRRRWLVGGVVAVAVFEVAYGTRQLLAGSLQVWGVEVLGVTDRLRGTYVNPNHVAYLLEIALAVVFAAGWWALVHARRESSLDRRLILLMPPIVLWLVLLGGLALTRSRAGLLAAVVGAGVQVVLAAASRRRWGAAPAGLAAVLVGLGIVVGVVSQSAFARLLGTSLQEVAWGTRVVVARRTLGLWADYPLTGSGLGSFRDAFTTVEPPGLGGSAFLHAHQDYLELAATGGLLALLLAAVGLVALVRRLRRVQVSGYRTEDRAAALAALGALAAVAVHEAFDFGLTLPANAFVLTAVCGAAAGARVLAGRQQANGARAEGAGDGDRLDEVQAGGDRHLAGD